MRFRNEQNEIFWKNMIKHNLTRYEWKVLIAFVTDAPTYNTSITDLYKRTSIQKPHISRALRGLCYQEILIQTNKVYALNEHMFQSEYQPVIKSTAAHRNNKEKNYKSGNGDFRAQSDNKKSNIKKMENNIREMYAKKKAKTNQWISYYSVEESKDIFIQIEENMTGGLIRWRCGGNDRMAAIAPMHIAEEVCRLILKITDPKKIINYIYHASKHDFMAKYNLKSDGAE